MPLLTLVFPQKMFYIFSFLGASIDSVNKFNKNTDVVLCNSLIGHLSEHTHKNIPDLNPWIQMSQLAVILQKCPDIFGMDKILVPPHKKKQSSGFTFQPAVQSA